MSRISKRELDKATFRPLDHVKQQPEVEDSQVPDKVFYTIFGNHFAVDEHGNPLTDDEKKSYAKMEKRGRGYDYYVKVGNSGHLYNPIGLYSSHEERKVDSLRGRQLIRFMKVKKGVFDYYVTFLRTKNAAWLKNAEREV